MKAINRMTSKEEEEVLAAGVVKHGVGNRRTMHTISKFARYLAQKSTSGLWKKKRTMTFRVADEKQKPFSPKVKTERVSGKAEEDVGSMMDVQCSADPAGVTEKILKMEELEDIKSRLMLLHKIWGRFSTKDTNRVCAPAFPQAVKESMKTSETAEVTDRFSATSPPQPDKKTERSSEVEDFEDLKSRLMLVHENIYGRFSTKDTNRVSAPAFPQAKEESIKTSDLPDDSDRFSTNLRPPQAEEETEISSVMEEDTDGKSHAPAPPEVVEEARGISETEEDTRSMLLLMNQIYDRFK